MAGLAIGVPITGMLKGLAGGKEGGGGMISGIVGTLGSLGKLVPIATAILGAVGILVASSKMLQKTLGVMVKLFMLIIKPLGDIFAVALMPILYILRPIAQFFNMLMRPYIQKAMTAMRAGGQFLKAGMPEQAIEAFTLGFQFLVKPLADLLASIFPTIAKSVDQWGRELDQELVLATTGATIAVSGSVQEMMSNLQRNFEMLNKLEIDPEIIGAIYNDITDELKRVQGYAKGDWRIYAEAATVLDSITKYVEGTGEGDKWGIYTAATKKLTDISAWAESQWAFQTEVESKLSGLSSWADTSWDFDTMVENKFINLSRNVNTILDDMQASTESKMRRAADNVSMMSGIFGPVGTVYGSLHAMGVI